MSSSFFFTFQSIIYSNYIELSTELLCTQTVPDLRASAHLSLSLLGQAELAGLAKCSRGCLRGSYGLRLALLQLLLASESHLWDRF